jgi:membrane-associated phospholipid phosphatase
MHYLRGVAAHWPVWSIAVQDALWKSYVTGSGAITGISAMPSLHVTVAAIIALLAWNTDRRFGMAMWIFTAIIVIGSVHLAWHYAVDGLAGLALAYAFWKLAGLVATHEARRLQTCQTAGAV